MLITLPSLYHSLPQTNNSSSSSRTQENVDLKDIQFASLSLAFYGKNFLPSLTAAAAAKAATAVRTAFKEDFLLYFIEILCKFSFSSLLVRCLCYKRVYNELDFQLFLQITPSTCKTSTTE